MASRERLIASKRLHIANFELQTAIKKWRLWPFLLAFFIPFVVYIITMPNGITRAHYGADSGELIAAAVTLGIPHPPGYPTYVVLGKLFSLLPIGSVASRFSLFSITAVSLTAALLTLINNQPKRWTAVLPALIFAFTAPVWSQAIIAEVYGLNLLMVALFLWAVHKKRPFFITLFLGLSITTHLTSLFLLPLALITIPPSQWKQAGGGLLAGLSPLLLLPLLAQGNSPVVWGDPTTLRGWIWLISGELYHPNAFGVPLTAVYPRIISWLREGVWQVLILLPLTLITIWKQRDTHARHSPLTTLLTAVIYLLYALTYNTTDAIVLVLPAVLLLTTLLPRSAWLLPVPILLLLLNYNAVTLHNEPPSPAAHILEMAPADAILLTEGDSLIFDLWYYQQAEGTRPDVLLVDADLFAFDWYRARLGRLHPNLQALTVDDLTTFQEVNEIFNVKSADYADVAD